jgi:aspartate/methionine/tyrosine aminotransferase
VDEFMAGMADRLSWCPPPPAGVFGWVEARDGRSLSAQLERARQEQDVLVAPGAFFGNDAAFRLSWVTAAARLEPALSRLSHALRVESGSLP